MNTWEGCIHPFAFYILAINKDHLRPVVLMVSKFQFDRQILKIEHCLCLALREFGANGDMCDSGMVISDIVARAGSSISEWFKTFCVACCLLKSSANDIF
jgi:hypothetical protein